MNKSAPCSMHRALFRTSAAQRARVMTRARVLLMFFSSAIYRVGGREPSGVRSNVYSRRQKVAHTTHCSVSAHVRSERALCTHTCRKKEKYGRLIPSRRLIILCGVQDRESSRLHHIRVRCHTQSSTLFLHWCPEPGGAAAANANLFHFQLTFYIVFGYLRFFLVFLMLATSSSSNFTPFRRRAGRIGSCWCFLCVAHGPQIFLLLSLRIHFPLLSIFHCFFHFGPCVVIIQLTSCRRFSFFKLEEFFCFIFPSSFWSSRSSVGFVPGFHPAAFTSQLSSGSDAILIANLHFILL